MNEICELATNLAKMGIQHASLEVDMPRLRYYKKQVDNEMKDSMIIYNNDSTLGKPLGFTVQIYGVKMYFNNPKTVVEQP